MKLIYQWLRDLQLSGVLIVITGIVVNVGLLLCGILLFLE